MFAIVAPLLPLLAVPGADEFVKIIVALVLCLIVIAALHVPFFQWPASWVLWGTRIVGAAFLIFLLYEVLFVITGIL